MLTKLTNQEKLIKYKWLYFKPSNVNEYDFRDYNSLKELFKATYYRNLKIEDAERKQGEFMAVLNALEEYSPRKPDYVTARKNLLINAKKKVMMEERLLMHLKTKYFHLVLKTFFEDEDECYTPRELGKVPEHPNFEDKEKTPRDIPELESEESAAQRRNQRGQGLKIFTPQQMLSRLSISLAQLKAGNNSETLKIEVRQPLYSLYRSKKLSKIIYNNLINAI